MGFFLFIYYVFYCCVFTGFLCEQVCVCISVLVGVSFDFPLAFFACVCFVSIFVFVVAIACFLIRETGREVWV